MRALTVSQPYANLIVNGEKPCENRSRRTHYRGPVLIHAGSGTQYQSLRESQSLGQTVGAIVGIAWLTKCYSIADLRRIAYDMNPEAEWGVGLRVADLLASEHTIGPQCWLLRYPCKFRKPIPCKGRLGLWYPGENVMAEVDREIDELNWLETTSNHERAMNR